MLIAKDSNGKLVKIINSVSGKDYFCPICDEKLIRNYGVERQYYSHPMGLGDECELKMRRFLKNNNEIEDKDVSILEKEYYNKKLDDVKVEMSDYISEDGYCLTKEQEEIIFSNEDRVKISALAGSSKTTTLYYYAKERPFKRILYLVYNKSMQNEATKTFGKLGNVEIRTIHSMAGLTSNIIANMRKSEYISIKNLEKICKTLSCTLNEVFEFIKEVES